MRRTGLSAGIAIYDKLKGILPDRVHPIYADFDTILPFIVYERGDITTEIDKDGEHSERVHISVAILADSYDGCVALAERVRGALRGVYADHDLRVSAFHFEGADEGREDNIYMQKLNFTLDID